MKKLSVIVSAALAVCLCVCLLAGCTESLKQDKIATQYADTVSSNGGMAVVYGGYLYFINGFADSSVDNTFGKVVKGAVARVALKDGKPDGAAQIIVPKNVYGTDTVYGGIYIVNDYIYYATPNTELDKDGKQKNTEGVIMRTKVDGTDTKEVVKFSDHSFVFRVAGDKLVYIKGNALHSVNLADKKFADTTVEETIGSTYIFEGDYLYYVMSNPDGAAGQCIKAYPLAGGDAKILVNAEKLGSTANLTFTLLSVLDEGNSVKLFYKKSDSAEPGTPATGIYASAFVKTEMNYVKEDRFTLSENSSVSYSKFYKADKYYLASLSQKIDVFDAEGNHIMVDGVELSIDFGSAITVSEIQTTATDIYLWYVSSNVLYKMRIMTKQGDDFVYVEDNAQKVFSASYNSSYVGFDKIGDVIYYFNSNISDNAYYYVIEDGAEDTAKGKMLGIITDSDIINAF